MYEHRYRENKQHGVRDFPFDIYKVKHQSDTSIILPLHWHNEMEIIYLAKGTAVFKVEGREFSAQAGDAVIVHPGEHHSGIKDHSRETCYYSIVFKLSWLSSLQHDRIQEQFLGPIQQGDIRLPAYLSATGPNAHILDYFRQLVNGYESRLPAYELSVKGLMLQLFAEFFQQGLVVKSAEGKTNQGREMHQQIKLVLNYMEEHCHEKLDLDALASVVSLSRSHFCKFFKTQTGMRPMEYLNYIRVNKAAHLLLTGSYNVLEAALECGFQNVSYFAKWFKVYMNMSPSAYKAQHTSYT
ncbi:AraC family transcriptional regulator [Paenibacillus physcomitrellae]|uniref:AraC family transcriptional regulator n=1 Tax=Paenibacillus physcomitrellae TaxID=1619311 RepID=A0ABQ1FRX5_9BACL|nr:AraC family transcriptional regulator [Paenibacillus physcomitrellae]GGA28627.1 AraC family transcriptional regulator [Paenibacillus physcomitrellae]